MKRLPWKHQTIETQEMYIKYIEEKIEEAKQWKSVVLFTDAMHQIHTSESWYAWQKRGKGWTKTIESNTGRRRINITWAYNPLECTAITNISEENCNITSTKSFFDLIRKTYIDLSTPIHLFMDNARYQKAYEVQEYADTLNIVLEYLPPYSPNLNLIERFWKFTKKIVVRNKYYEAFGSFVSAFKSFFQSLDSYKSSLKSLLTLKFEIINNY